MDMKVNSKRIRAEREKRAWSQEHLANVSGLGVRTVHRIENSGSASLESIKAIAAVFELEAADLQINSTSEIVIPRELSLPKLLLALLKSPVVILLKNDSPRSNAIRVLSIALITIAMFTSYFVGFNMGVTVLLAIGGFLELTLWFKLTEAGRPSHLDT